jgi:hypothetical protein
LSSPIVGITLDDAERIGLEVLNAESSRYGDTVLKGFRELRVLDGRNIGIDIGFSRHNVCFITPEMAQGHVSPKMFSNLYQARTLQLGSNVDDPGWKVATLLICLNSERHSSCEESHVFSH